MVNEFCRGHFIRIPLLSEFFNFDDDSFIIMDVLQGGMAQCFKIEHLKSKNIFAVKMIHKKFLENYDIYEYYIEEIKKWITLSACDGIVEAFTTIKINDIPCVISEWMNNGDLYSIMNSGNPITFIKATERIIKTLKWVYDNYKIVHRDLKPGNILLDSESLPYINDWGIAKWILNSDNRNSFSISGSNNPYVSNIYTLGYSSPEQIMGKKEFDCRSDIFSLGCILYEWIEGMTAFNNKDEHLNKIPVLTFNERNKNLILFKDIILKCLNKNPDERFFSYDELWNEIRNKIKLLNLNIKETEVKKRYETVIIGEGDITKTIQLNNLANDSKITNLNNYALIDRNKITKHLKEAKVLCDIKEYRKAINILKYLVNDELIIDFPDFPEYQEYIVNYALCLIEIGEFNEALNKLLLLKNAKNKSAAYYTNLSYVYICMFNWNKAKLLSEEGLSKYPDDMFLLNNLTTSLTKLNEHESALKFALKSVDMDANIKSLIGLGNTYFNIAESLKNTDLPKAFENYDNAICNFKKAISLNPNFYDAKINLCHCLFKTQRIEECQKECLKIYKSNSNINFKIISLLIEAKILLWHVGYMECINFCDGYLDKIKESDNRFFIHLRRVREEAALNALWEAKKIGKSFPINSAYEFFKKIINDENLRIESDFSILAQIILETSNVNCVNDAIEVLTKGINLYPNHWRYYFVLSLIYNNVNYIEIAYQNILKASELAPWRESVWGLMSVICSKLNKENEAKFANQKYLQVIQDKKQLYNN